MSNIFDADVRVRGTLIPAAIAYPNESIGNAAISPAANIAANKTQHRFAATHAQPNSAATAETRTLQVIRRGGTITEVLAGSIAAATGDSTATVDVRKNGTTILTAPIVLDSANTARTPEVGTIDGSAGTVAIGDWVEVVITIAAGTGTLPTGLFCQVEIDENGI